MRSGSGVRKDAAEMQSAYSLAGPVTTTPIRRWEAERYDWQNHEEKCAFVSTGSPINLVRDFYIGPVRRDMTLGMPWATQWKVRMRTQEGAIEVLAPGAEERVHLSMLPTAVAPYTVRGVERASQDKEWDMTPKHHRTGTWNGGDMHALGHTASTKAPIVGTHSSFPARKCRSGSSLRISSAMC